MSIIETSLLKTLCFFDVLDYPPTLIEWMAAYQQEVEASTPTINELEAAITQLVQQNRVRCLRGCYAFPNREAIIAEHEDRTGFLPRKLRRARFVTEWLSRINGVRFVALCNTTAMAHAKDESDLDFFVITRDGSLWQSRGWSTLPFKLLGLRPKPNEERDAICLSFFIDDSALNLSPLLLNGDDPYFHFWFLNLLPLYDDGVGTELWNANKAITKHHPLAPAWIMNPALAIKRKQLRIPTPLMLESLAQTLQTKALHPSIKARMNVSNDVVIDKHHLKFHTEDGRRRYRDLYAQRCHEILS